jgi:hypothetical protein
MDICPKCGYCPTCGRSLAQQHPWTAAPSRVYDPIPPLVTNGANVAAENPLRTAQGFWESGDGKIYS